MDSEFVLAAFLRRLRAISGLDGDDVDALRSLPIVIKEYRPGQAIVRDGDRPVECCLMVEGFAVRSKTLSDGRRQILAIHIPGEMPDLQSLHLHIMDHDLVTVTDCTLAFISHVALRAVTRERPRIAELLWRDTLIDAAMFREWIVNVGQRAAPSRLAHIIVELRARLRIIGRGTEHAFEMPLTQEQIAEALGVTPVHANRIFRQLREDKVLNFQRGQVTVLDDVWLRTLADFDDRYLHQAPSQ